MIVSNLDRSLLKFECLEVQASFRCRKGSLGSARDK